MLSIWQRFPRVHKISISALAVVTVSAALLPADDAEASRNTNKVNTIGLEPGKRHELEIEIPITEPKTTQQPQVETKPTVNTRVITAKVKKNDSLAKIFSRNGISAKTLLQVSKAGDTAKAIIQDIRPGDKLLLTLNDENQLLQLQYPVSRIESIFITLDDNNQYQGHKEHKTVDSSEAVAFAKIETTFWGAGVDAGLTESQIMNLANIFGWDIDFALDLRKGDSFNIVYEKRYVDGEYIGPGKILAAEFINQSDKYSAIRHTDGNYYTPEGRSMRKAFLRAPVNFKYISSSFNPRRLHPVTGKVRPHRGIDYAARTGTPVSASGDGKVIKSGYSGLNGNYVFIQHGEKYVTKYLHLHKRHVKKGQKVKQGQKIGTVGATGRVTGAHLHYEFLVDGVHRNPKTVKLPKAVPIDRQSKEAFLVQAKKMQALLASNERILLAAQ